MGGWSSQVVLRTRSPQRHSRAVGGNGRRKREVLREYAHPPTQPRRDGCFFVVRDGLKALPDVAGYVAPGDRSESASSADRTRSQLFSTATGTPCTQT